MTDYKPSGFNFMNDIEELKNKKPGNDKRTLEKIERKIKKSNNRTAKDVKIVFNFKTYLKKLVYYYEFLLTTGGGHYQHIWSGILNFPVSQGFLFGRATRWSKSGIGKYCFAPFNHEFLIDFIKKWIESYKANLDDIKSHFDKFELLKDFFSERVEEEQELYNSMEYNIELEPFISVLNKFRYSIEAVSFMKKGRKLISQSPVKSLHNKLNEDSQLIKVLKKITHFGNLFTAVSSCDISLFCFPYESETIFQVCDFSTKHTITAINELLKRLIDLQMKNE